MMKFAAIFITALFGASTATAVDHMDGNRVLQDVDDAVPQDVVSNESKPNLASVLAATSPNLADQILSSAVPPLLRGAESFATNESHQMYHNDQAVPTLSTANLSATVVSGQTVYTGCGNTYVVEADRDSQCCGGGTCGGTSTIITVDPVVNCKDGMAFDNSESPKSLGTTCFQECNDGKDCCGPSESACAHLTGKVAKDGSCMGDYACQSDYSSAASIGLISGASCVGKLACSNAGNDGGHVGDISGASCVGEGACYVAGYYNGHAGDISEGSCVGYYACTGLGWGGGNVGNVIGCCTQDYQCYLIVDDADLPKDCSSSRDHNDQAVPTLFTANPSANVVSGQTVYTGCGNTYVVEAVRDSQCCGGGTCGGTSKIVIMASVVNCKDGMAFDNSESPKSLGTTCFQECNNGKDCCGPSESACAHFNGKVAKDGSCMGDWACANADDAGTTWGSIGLISGTSCVGNYACDGFGFPHHDRVGDISGASCVGEAACYRVGYNGGRIGDISEGSCVGYYVCLYAGRFEGHVGDISEGSCVGDYVCDGLGEHGSVGNLVNCCNQDVQCLERYIQNEADLRKYCSSGKGTISREAQVPSFISENMIG